MRQSEDRLQVRALQCSSAGGRICPGTGTQHGCIEAGEDLNTRKHLQKNSRSGCTLYIPSAVAVVWCALLNAHMAGAAVGGMKLWGWLALSVITVTVVGAVAHWKGQRDALVKQHGSNTSLSSLDAADGEASESRSILRNDSPG